MSNYYEQMHTPYDTDCVIDRLTKVVISFNIVILILFILFILL
jgi:hypothetical protein